MEKITADDEQGLIGGAPIAGPDSRGGQNFAAMGLAADIDAKPRLHRSPRVARWHAEHH